MSKDSDEIYVRHWKGGIYRLDGTSTHTENNETLMNFQCCKTLKSYSRPLKMFFETVIVDGKKVPRYETIEKPD